MIFMYVKKVQSGISKSIKDREKIIDDKTQLIDQAEKYLKYKAT